MMDYNGARSKLGGCKLKHKMKPTAAVRKTPQTWRSRILQSTVTPLPAYEPFA